MWRRRRRRRSWRGRLEFDIPFRNVVCDCAFEIRPWKNRYIVDVDIVGHYMMVWIVHCERNMRILPTSIFS